MFIFEKKAEIVSLGLNLLIHMDCFYFVFMDFLKLEHFGVLNFQKRDRNLSGFIKNIFNLHLFLQD